MAFIFEGMGSSTWESYALIYILAFLIFSMFGIDRWSLINSALITAMSYFMPLVFCGTMILVVMIPVWRAFLQHTEDVLGNFEGARGHQAVNASYRVAEVNADGTIIAYRYFIKDSQGYMSVTKAGLSRNGGEWEGGYLEADRIPTLKNTSGIYAAKTPDSPILEPYRDGHLTLAKVELSGRVIEAEFGYRAQRCRIITELE